MRTVKMALTIMVEAKLIAELEREAQLKGTDNLRQHIITILEEHVRSTS